MGTNGRYGSDVRTATVSKFMASGEPESLLPGELDLPYTSATEPVPVRVWVRFAGVPVQVDAEVVGWTPRAVHVRITADRVTRLAWVWRGAAERLPASES